MLRNSDGYLVMSESVERRLISDVPLGALLSGGVDSSIIVALMARISSGPVKTFSIGFQAEAFNEAEHARLVAEKFGTEHHELILDPNLEETLTFLTSMLEEPFGDSSMLPTYYVSRMAREHVTVALSGDGGDELFAGYDRYLVAMDRKKYDRIPAWLGLWPVHATMVVILGGSGSGKSTIAGALNRVLFDRGAEFRKALTPGGNKPLILPAVRQDNLQQAVDQRHVGAGVGAGG